MNISPKFKISLFIIAIALLGSCKQPETIVIDEDPQEAPAEVDTTESITAPPESDFMQLNIGELQRIPSFDPLFANNTSMMRTHQLIYEGLVRYNKNGSIVPALAKRWQVSDDSLTYTFTVRDSVFYHDSDVFSSGVGRKVVPADIKFVFERMAEVTVPDKAAGLFMQIEGFEPYFKEQQAVLNPSERVLPGISGISTPNDSTVTFKLIQKDPHFVNKLASPYASVYPREAIVKGKPSSFKAVGTGPFYFSKIENNTRLIFSKFDNYYIDGVPTLNRVDVLVQPKESEVFQSFAKKDIHLIPELGSQLLEGVLNNSAELKPSYRNQYNLLKTGSKLHFRLNYYPDGNLQRSQAHFIAGLVDSTFNIPSIKNNLVHFNKLHKDSISATSLPDTVSIAYTENPMTVWLTRLLAEKLKQQGSALQMELIRTPTRNTGLYYSKDFIFYLTDQRPVPANTLLEFSVDRFALSQINLEGVAFNHYPWWNNLRNVTVSDPN